MPWKEVTAMSEKLRFIELVTSSKTNFSELCRIFGISRKTGYKMLDRYKKEGKNGLSARSRTPQTSPNKTSSEIEELILSVRKKHPVWAGEKILTYLRNKGHTKLPSEKTIDRILKRYGLITAEESEKHKPYIRFEHEHPNDLWQMDFKGHFAVGLIRCFPLTILDDHSRFSLLIKACENQTGITVKQHLIEVFRQFGLPKSMTMDNGSPWGYSREQKHTQLTAWLIQLGIYVSHSRPKHPQTQGKLERFHRTFKLELLDQYHFTDLSDAQRGFDWWQTIYNEERPHAALNLEVPATRYRRSERNYSEIIAPPEYEADLAVRKVQHNGLISYAGKNYRVGEAFYGHYVGLKEEQNGVIDVYFYKQKVNKFDLRYPHK